MNYTTKSELPSAHITKRKSRLKIYEGDKVFLDDGDNFEFEIHNPKQISILVKIKLNGNYISNSGLVVRPGHRVFLNRYFDFNNKFQFNTYEVDNNPENRSAIHLNGDVQIEFYDEVQITPKVNHTVTYWTSNITTTSPFVGQYPNLNHTASDLSQPTYSVSYSESPIVGYCSQNNQITTGRIEMGEKSEQNFERSFDRFKEFPSHKITYKILPTTMKNKEVGELRQYCPECGCKVKKNFKYCPACGKKV